MTIESGRPCSSSLTSCGSSIATGTDWPSKAAETSPTCTAAVEPVATSEVSIVRVVESSKWIPSGAISLGSASSFAVSR
jgi:hypothetical protein